MGIFSWKQCSIVSIEREDPGVNDVDRRATLRWGDMKYAKINPGVKP